jgi:hypothetical protein
VVEGPGGLPVNEWSHVAGTYDGATLRLFVNGTQVASQAQIGNLQVNTGQLRIGGNTSPSEFFTGRIDEVRIYDVALDQSEIQTDMATPIPEAPSLQQLGAGALALALLARGKARWRRASTREAAAR